jgi:hypothetical protein
VPLGVVALLQLLAACAAGGGEAAPEAIRRTEKIPVTVSIEVAGDLVGKIVDRTVSTQLAIVDSDDPQLQSSRIFGIETIDPLPLESGVVTAGFGVVPYRGPGKYTIQPGSIFDLAKPQESGTPRERGSVKVLWRPDPSATSVYDYYRREEPCRVEIKKKGSEGKLECPRLTDERRDKHFSLTMRWKFAEQPPASS